MKNIIKNYTEQNYEFGIDSSCITTLTGMTSADAKALVSSISKNNSGM